VEGTATLPDGTQVPGKQFNYKNIVKDVATGETTASKWIPIPEVVAALPTATESPPDLALPQNEALPYTVTKLTAEQMAVKGITGTGFEITGKYQGKVPLDITVAMSKAIEDQFGRVRVCRLNPNMTPPAGERTQEMVLLGFYMAYLRDHNLNEGYTFEQYISDLMAGKDMSVWAYGQKLDGSLGKFKAKPGVVYFVATNTAIDQYGNGQVTTKPTYTTGFGYQEKANSGLGIIDQLYAAYEDDNEFCSHIGERYLAGFGVMGSNMIEFIGSSSIGAPHYKFPKSVDRINNDAFQRELWTAYRLNSWFIIQP
jgi:hypothetical protein